MARVQIHTLGSKKKFAPIPTNVYFQEVSYAISRAFRNQLIKGVSGTQTDISTEVYLLLWNTETENESYPSVLTGVLGQISRKGIKRVAIHHGPGMDDILGDMSETMLQNYGLRLAKKLMTNFKRMTVRLSFSRGDTKLPKLLRGSIRRVKATMAEA